jgi:hypothetical protein
MSPQQQSTAGMGLILKNHSAANGSLGCGRSEACKLSIVVLLIRLPRQMYRYGHPGWCHRKVSKRVGWLFIGTMLWKGKRGGKTGGCKSQKRLHHTISNGVSEKRGQRREGDHGIARPNVEHELIRPVPMRHGRRRRCRVEQSTANKTCTLEIFTTFGRWGHFATTADLTEHPPIPADTLEAWVASHPVLSLT